MAIKQKLRVNIANSSLELLDEKKQQNNLIHFIKEKALAFNIASSSYWFHDLKYVDTLEGIKYSDKT